ncbi:MAG: hemin receptor [Alphaproteobacteria bacterium]|nr:hemin receptor [Alphaproteobacteria bacterium]
MTPDQKHLVQGSWNDMAPIADTAADLFYRRLFEIDPTVGRMFNHTDLGEQRKRLVHVLDAAVTGLDDVDELIPVLESLGARHAAYGVTDAHYDTVGTALLWSFEQCSARSWTGETAEAWAAAYGLLSGVMRTATENAKQLTSAMAVAPA